MSEIGNSIRHQIEHYKELLRSGADNLFCYPRNSGRTQAILEFAHEMGHKGRSVAVVCGDRALAHFASRKFMAEFGGEGLPVLFVHSSFRIAGFSGIRLYDGIKEPECPSFPHQ